MNPARLVTSRSTWVVGQIILCLVVVSSHPFAQQQPVFRGGVDSIVVDVHVVRNDGTPVPSLTPKDFEVSVDNQRRNVVSVQFISSAATQGGAANRQTAPEVNALVSGTETTGDPAVYVLAIDGLSFDVGASRGVADVARQFVGRLPPSDLVGLYTYPLGPKIDPTLDRLDVRHALDQVVGQKEPETQGNSRLTASELEDFFSDPEFQRKVLVERCGNPRTGAINPGCAKQIDVDVRGQVMLYEAQGQLSLRMLGELFDQLGRVDARKTVVLLSAGMPVSIRVGGRPNLGNLPSEVGQKAARANASLYTLFIDGSYLERFSAANRRISTSMSARDSTMLMNRLDRFAGTAGGALMRVLVGNGETAFNRILKETSAYYIIELAVKPSDRDGQAHRIAVKVDQRGATVRARNWVVVPTQPRRF